MEPLAPLALRTNKISKAFRIWRSHTHLSDVFTQSFAKRGRGTSGDYPQPELLWALKDIDIEVRKGDLIGVVGRNGSGKSTLLKILSRITSPTAGSVELYGKVAALLEVGTGFHPELTGRENIFLNGSILGMKRREIQRHFDEIVDFSGLEKFLDVAIKRYSTGMYLRLAFAVAAHLRPEIILVDEVLAVGDAEFQRKCLGKMDSVSREGRTVILVSHQLNAIRKLCNRCMWIDAGRLAMVGDTDRVLGAYETSVAAVETEQRAQTRIDRAAFRSWQIDGASVAEKYCLKTLGPVKVEFVLNVPEVLKKSMVHLSLRNDSEQLMWGTQRPDLDFEPGEHRLSFSFPGLPLRPGVYWWEISLWNWSEYTVIDTWRAAPEMIIATEPLTHYLDQHAGILNIACDLGTSAGVK